MIKVLFLNLLLSNSFFSFQKNNDTLEINDINKINLELLNRKIDSVINEAISLKAFPGAQILVIKDGNKIVNKNYGFHTYDSLIKVSENSIYDIASLTKVTSSTLSLMKLYDKNLFFLEKPLSYYLKTFKKTDKGINQLVENIFNDKKADLGKRSLISWISPVYLEALRLNQLFLD